MDSRLVRTIGRYLFVQLDIIPDRIPVVGHLDEAAFVIGGFVLARAFADPPA